MLSILQPHELYKQQMLEVKRRFRAVDWILGAKKPISRDSEIDCECAFLQIRKIIELIAFSAIVSDKQRYQRSRQLATIKIRKIKEITH